VCGSDWRFLAGLAPERLWAAGRHWRDLALAARELAILALAIAVMYRLSSRGKTANMQQRTTVQTVEQPEIDQPTPTANNANLANSEQPL